ncbi:MAG: DUF4293 family protein [Ferruginibacter sp.]|nr:DUF4293 family protein [Ferruginibacter sp.]
MLQRIQSVWLLLASVCAFLTLKFSFYSGTNAKGVASYQLNGMENTLLLIPTLILALLVLANIFLFKNRVLQIRLCIAAMVLELLLLFLYYKQTQSFSLGTYSLTAILHIGILLFLLLAARAINKDEKMVKNSDRLR